MTTKLMNPIFRAAYERELDQTLAASFPASDPLPWTLGVEADDAPPRSAPQLRRPVVTEVIVGDERFGHRARAIVEVFGLAALVPLGILLAGAPIAAVVQALLSLVTPVLP